MYKILLHLSLIISAVNYSCTTEEFCGIEEKSCTEKTYRYLLYDVNPPEGFNLRRDVYMRFAVFAHHLQKSPKANLNAFKLVLPPWPSLHHWRTSRDRIPWSHFFDLESLRKFAPVVEMHRFFYEIDAKFTKVKIDEVYILQHFKEMFDSGKFEDKMEVQKCTKDEHVGFYNYTNVTADRIQCLSFHGYVAHLAKILSESNARTIFFDHAEVALHDQFGSGVYWQARRSMRFNKELLQAANEFRKWYLNSTDEADGTELPEDWREEKSRRTARGGPYLSVHLRRRDFAWGRPNDVPSIKSAAQQIKAALKKLALKTVFIATDAPDREYDDLEHLLRPDFAVLKYVSDRQSNFKDGSLAVIDQIICSHARHFLGTHESTFSFRIQEEREILGFPVETTFNRLCGDNTEKCEKPSKWTIVY